MIVTVKIFMFIPFNSSSSWHVDFITEMFNGS